MLLTNLKQRLGQLLKQQLKLKLADQYDAQDMVSIIAGIEGDITALKNELQQVKQTKQILQDAVQALSDTSLLDEFHTDSDANMIAFVASKMPGLTTDEQRLWVVIALQDRRLYQ